MEHSCNFLYFRKERRHQRWLHVIEIPGKHDEVLGFGKGTLSDIQKPGKILIPLPFRPFSNISWNRNGSATQLRDQPIPFIVRQGHG